MKKLVVLGQPTSASIRGEDPRADRPAPATAGERADAARNRERILLAARALLLSRPIGQICMDEVARTAGVGKGTLYRRFKDRSSLCMALLDENERALQGAVLNGFNLPAGTAAQGRLFALLAALLEFGIENAALLAEADAFERRQGGYFDGPVYAWRRRLVARLIRQLPDGVTASPDPELTADMLLIGLNPHLLLWYQSSGVAASHLREAYALAWARLLGVEPAPG